MTEPTTPVRPGVKRRTGRGHIDSYGDDRRCRAANCETILSRYNDQGLCWRHSGVTNPRHR